MAGGRNLVSCPINNMAFALPAAHFDRNESHVIYGTGHSWFRLFDRFPGPFATFSVAQTKRITESLTITTSSILVRASKTPSSFFERCPNGPWPNHAARKTALCYSTMDCHSVSCPINNVAFVAIKMGRRQGVRSGAYLNRYVTDEQRSRRPIFIATLRAVASWLFFRVARSLRINLDMLVARALKNSQLIRQLPDESHVIYGTGHLATET